MNGTKAKLARKLVYGTEFSPRVRTYAAIELGKRKVILKGGGELVTAVVTIVADQKRQLYQKTKHLLTRRKMQYA